MVKSNVSNVGPLSERNRLSDKGLTHEMLDFAIRIGSNTDLFIFRFIIVYTSLINFPAEAIKEG